MACKLVLRFAVFLCIFLIQCRGDQVNNNYKSNQPLVDPNTYLSPPKIIARYGYPSEAHVIQSADGYLLEYHRIPHGKYMKKSKNPYPILLHHGLLCSSFDWIVNGPEKSLGFLLADEGYDVWMANARGNTFSRSHIKLNPKEQEFWNYTFHEMGHYDLAAAVDYILNKTESKKIIYIGHSLGTTTFYAFASTRPEYNSKILVHIGIAPVGMLSHTTSAFRYLVPIAKQIQSVYDWYSKGAFLEKDLVSSLFCKFLCGTSVLNYNVCEQLIIFKLFGKDIDQFNKTLIPALTNNMPAGTSSKNMVHCSQLISSGKFRQYDYGLKENILRYNSATPPSYNFSKITVPVKFYYGKNDILADPLDVKLLYQKLPKPMGCKIIPYEKWNHVDFLWAIDVNRYFNDDLILFLRNITHTPGFIRETVISAFNQRLNEPFPDNVPFDGAQFLENKFNGLSTMGDIQDILHDFPDENIFSNFANSTRKQFEDGMKKIQTDFTENVKNAHNTISNQVQETGRSIQKTAQDIHSSFNAQVMKAKESIESSAKEIEKSMQQTFKKLQSVFTL